MNLFSGEPSQGRPTDQDRYNFWPRLHDRLAQTDLERFRYYSQLITSSAERLNALRVRLPVGAVEILAEEAVLAGARRCLSKLQDRFIL